MEILPIFLNFMEILPIFLIFFEWKHSLNWKLISVTIEKPPDVYHMLRIEKIQNVCLKSIITGAACKIHPIWNHGIYPKR